jgi:hypothetical protein
VPDIDVDEPTPPQVREQVIEGVAVLDIEVLAIAP